jgi:hypothetical protein
MTEALLEAGGWLIFCALIVGLAWGMDRAAAFHERGLARVARWEDNNREDGKR